MKLKDLHFYYYEIVGIDINGCIKYMVGHEAYLWYGDYKIVCVYNVGYIKVFKIVIYNISIQYYDGYEKWLFNIEKYEIINNVLYITRDFTIEHVLVDNAWHIEVKEK